MTYLRDKKQNTRKIIYTGLVVFVLVYIILFTRVFNIISSDVNFIAVPIWKTQSTISDIITNINVWFESKKSLEEKNRRLKDDLDIAGGKLIDRNLLYNENIKLKGLLGRKAKTGVYVFAAVLTKPDRSLYDTIIIDIGKNSGVKKNDKVLYGDNIVIGKIAEVFDNSSKVLLLSSPREKVDVVIGSNNISAIADGRGGGNFEIKLPRDAKVYIGDAVSVPGMDTHILGVVEYIESTPSDPFKTIIFRGTVDIFKLKWVEVITGSS